MTESVLSDTFVVARNPEQRRWGGRPGHRGGGLSPGKWPAGRGDEGALSGPPWSPRPSPVVLALASFLGLFVPVMLLEVKKSCVAKLSGISNVTPESWG